LVQATLAQAPWQFAFFHGRMLSFAGPAGPVT